MNILCLHLLRPTSKIGCYFCADKMAMSALYIEKIEKLKKKWLCQLVVRFPSLTALKDECSLVSLRQDWNTAIVPTF